MLESREFRTPPLVYFRAEPDDEYEYPMPDPLDPYLTGDDDGRLISDLEEEEELEDDEP